MCADPQSPADREAFVNLLHTARSDADLRRRLLGLLQLPAFHRQSALATLVEQMRLAGAPTDFADAFALLRDDAIAARALELLEDPNLPLG